jgi:hypothetical protein
MSMSEFERPENEEKKEFSSLSIQGPNRPDDFTEEDLAFARELHLLFSPEEEDLPPYYIQTLLDADDQRFEPVARGFEYRTSACVFRRLKLRRRLFYTPAFPLSLLSMGIDRSVRRSMLAMIGSFVMVMLLTVVLTGASFASGFATLLRGTHGNGTYSINYYPYGMVMPSQAEQSGPSTVQTTLLDAQQEMDFPLYVPEYIPSLYVLEHINFYVGLDQQWADGPMLEFEYGLPPSAGTPKGTGEIWVREFLPRANVLQLVAQNAAVPIQMDNDGEAMAIYVNGQWVPQGRSAPIWVYGERSELIYQLDGVIFWIVGDQRDGVGEQQLMQIAKGLAIYPLGQMSRMLGASVPVMQMNEDVPGPFSNDVIVIFPNDGDGGVGAYYIDVSSYQPPRNAH